MRDVTDTSIQAETINLLPDVERAIAVGLFDRKNVYVVYLITLMLFRYLFVGLMKYWFL